MQNKDMFDHPSTSHDENAATECTIRLTHAALMTQDLSKAVDFYTNVLGLSLRVEEEDPLRKGHQRAMLIDASGADAIELIEYRELQHVSVPGHGAVNHVGFHLPERSWHSLRSRLDEISYPYQEVEGRLFLRDADEVVLEVEST